MQAPPQQIRAKTQQYELHVKFQGSELLIELFVLIGQPKLFALKLANESIPQDLELIFGEVSILFECFKSPYEVVLPQNSSENEAHIKVKAIYQFRNRTIEKQALLNLPRVNISVEDQLRRKIQSLQKQLKTVSEDKVQEFYQIGSNLLGVKKQESSKQDKKISQILEKLDRAKQEFGKVKQYFDSVYEKTVEAVKQAKESLKSTEKLVSETSTIFKKLQSRKQMRQQKQDKISVDQKSHQGYPDVIQSFQGVVSEINVDLSHQISQSNAQSQKSKKNPVITVPSENQQLKLRVLYKRWNDDYFKVNDNRITHLYESNSGDQIVLDYKMKIFPLKNKYIDRFKVKIIRSKINNIYIGVIPFEKRTAKKTNEVICYFGMDGELWDGKPLEPKVGQGFKQGDIVEVHIKTKKIKWKVNGKVEASYHSDKFGSEKFVYLPVIEILGGGDCVQWIP